MRRFIVLPAVALAASGNANDVNSQASLGRVQVTLQSLLRNIQDTGRHAEKALKQRHVWCESTTAAYSQKEEAERTDLEHLRLDLLEQEAALEEAEGSLRERHAEVAMLQHTINMTAEVLQDAKLNASLTTDGQQGRDRSEAEQRLGALLQSRQQTVVSLEEELGALNPKVAQLQAQVAEGRRQISDRTSSSNAQASFGAAVRDSCAASLRNADKKATLRVAEAAAISKALQALEQLGVAPVTQAEKSTEDDAALAQGLEQVSLVQAQKKTADDAAQVSQVSFVQLKSEQSKAGNARDAPESTESGEEQLDDLFGGDDDAAPEAPAAASAAAVAPASSDASEDEDDSEGFGPGVEAIATMSDSAAVAKAISSDSSTDDADEDVEAEEEEPLPAPTRPLASLAAQKGSVKGVEQLLSAVTSEDEAEQSRRSWCSQERSRNEQSLQLAKDAVERAAGEALIHSDMEGQLGGVLDNVRSAQSQIGTTAQEVADDATKELASLETGVKDQDLATKILNKASKFLQEADMAGDMQGSKQGAVKAAVQALAKAKSFFQEEERASEQGKEETNQRVSAITAVAEDAKAALEKEANGVILARDSHADLRRRSEEDKATREAESAELEKYIQGLGSSCETVAGDSADSNPSPEERQQKAEVQMLEDAKKVLKGEKLGETRRGNSGLRGGAAKVKVDTSKLTPLQRAALEMGLSTDGS